VAFGEACKPSEALEKLQKETWDVVVLDISLPGRGGVDALRDMKTSPSHGAGLGAEHASRGALCFARAARGGGRVREQGGRSRGVAGAVRKVLMGGTHVSARLAEALAKSLSHGSSRPAHERLSDRELEVMRGIATGKTVKEISAGLALSEKTISTYRTRLLEKMQMHSNAELIQYALHEGLVA